MVTIIEPSTFTELIFPDLTGPPEFMEILDTRARFEVNLNWYGGVFGVHVVDGGPWLWRNGNHSQGVLGNH